VTERRQSRVRMYYTRPPHTRQSGSGMSNIRGPDSILKNAASSFAAQMTTASLTAVLTLFLVRALGPKQYGLFAVAISVSAIAIAFADVGISSSTARFVADHRGRGAELSALIADALKLKVVITGLVCALLAALASLIAGVYGDPELVWPLRGIALATFGQSTFLMLAYVMTALGRVVVNVRLTAIESMLEISASVALVLAGAGAAGAAFGRAIGYVLGAVIAACVVLRLSGHGSVGFWSLPRRATVRRVGVYAGSTFAIDVSYTLSASLSVVLLGAFAGATAAGIFQAPAKLIVLIQYVGASAANGVAPRLARGHGQEPNVRALARALRGLIAFQCLMLAPAIVWAGPIAHVLLGTGYSQSADVLRALAPYIFFCGLAPLVTTGVTYLGEAGRRVPIALATLALAAAGGFILIPSHGVVGAAIATDVAFGFYTLAHIWLCRRLLQLRIGSLLWSLARGLTAAAAMGFVLALVGTKDLTISDWLIGGVAGLATYIAMLIFTREIRGPDIARAAASMSALFPRVHPARAEDATPAPSSKARHARRHRSPAAAPPAWLDGLDPQPAPPVEAAAPERSPAADPPRWLAVGVRGQPARRSALADSGQTHGISAAVPDRRHQDPSPAARLADPGELRTPAAADDHDREHHRPHAAQPSSWLSSERSPAQAGDRSSVAVKATRQQSKLPSTLPPTAVRPRFRADVLYQIAWRPEQDTGVFELRPVEPSDVGDRASGISPPTEPSSPVPCAGHTVPAPIPDALSAHAALVDRLLTAGWRRAGCGDPWFAHRFRSPEPPHPDGARHRKT
jgi:O-antigen/teichoic acid export membrane protein